MIEILLLIIGFAILIKGADWLIDGAVSLARAIRVSDLVIGLTIVAFGTSAPELFVNIFSAIGGNHDLAIGNILGSNISNILLILGLTALIFPITVNKSLIKKEIPYSIFAAILVLFITADRFIFNKTFNSISRFDGIMLLGFFGIFLFYLFLTSKYKKEVTKPKHSGLESLGLVSLGFFCLFVGGQFVIHGATFIAKYFGLSEALIGLTIIAIGTSIPELVTSIVAAFKKRADVAVGTVVGSNIFNILLVLGVTSTIAPLMFSSFLIFDVIIVIIVSLFLLLFAFVSKNFKLERWQGLIFLLMYISYIAFIILKDSA
jgi:cation:H+ antiporter